MSCFYVLSLEAIKKYVLLYKREKTNFARKLAATLSP